MELSAQNPSELPAESVLPDSDDMRIDSPVPAQIAAYMAEINELRAEVERLRVERSRLTNLQTRVAELLGSKNPDKIVHDLRNLLNERALLKALIGEL